MYVDFHSLLGYVFDDISKEEREKIDSFFYDEKGYQDIIEGLFRVEEKIWV